MSGAVKNFSFIEENYPGDVWLQYYQSAIESYRRWFLKEGEFKRPSYQSCSDAIKSYMPKIYPLYEHLLALTHADDTDARLLSFYCPASYLSGCSQAVWQRYNPFLVRNYDYAPELCEGRIIKSKYHQTAVIASSDCLWGALDGMNEHGLALALSFGGKEHRQEGFGMPLILRYILEFCQTSDEAVECLQTIPAHMAYNITIVDAEMAVRSVELCPDRPPVVSFKPFAVNHQGDYELSSYAMFSRSYERQQTLQKQLYDPLINAESFIDAFEYSPLFVTEYENNFGTLYTSIYNPRLKSLEFRWPYHLRMAQSFEFFEARELWVSY